MSRATLYCGDALTVLKRLPSESVRCCVTSPPYWGLRDYGVAGQLGLERTPEEYIATMVAVFREVRRVLIEDGTLWLNLGDSYAQAGGPGWQGKNGQRADRRFTAVRNTVAQREIGRRPPPSMKSKDLVGIPWMLAFALRSDGWWLRSDIIWSKKNPMPESVTDRPTKSHEYVFLLSKAARYYYDAEAIAEPWKFRNARSVWEIATQPYPEAHFATFPEELARRCILAGSAPGDVLLDPFGGSGTVAQVATGNGRGAVYIDLNPKYVEMARQRIGPMLCRDTVVVP